jgi:RimJ/RimL family protein N-acetyltransferase
VSEKLSDSHTVTFRLLQAQDFPLMHCWLNKEHVRAGWFADGTYPPDGYSLESITRDFTPDLEETSPITPLIIEYGGKAIGYVQIWRVEEFLHYAGPFIDDDTPPSRVASFDIFIGDEDYVGRGLSPEIVG